MSILISGGTDFSVSKNDLEIMCFSVVFFLCTRETRILKTHRMRLYRTIFTTVFARSECGGGQRDDRIIGVVKSLFCIRMSFTILYKSTRYPVYCGPESGNKNPCRTRARPGITFETSTTTRKDDLVSSTRALVFIYNVRTVQAF